MFRTTKKDMVFYNLFSSVMSDTRESAEILESLFKNLTDLDEKVVELGKKEHTCDRLVHDVIDQLNHSFITPLDREDIFVIAKVIDNIMDSIESTANRLKLFHITEIRPASVEMAELINTCVKVLCAIVDDMPNMKTSKTMHDNIVEVNRLENQGDAVYRDIVENLFTAENDTLEIIKWKEIIERMEQTLDACEDVANVIEGIVSKNV